MNEGKGRNKCGAGVANARHEANQWIEAKPKLRSGHAEEFVHDEREPLEQRFETFALPFFFRRQNLPVNFL